MGVRYMCSKCDLPFKEPQKVIDHQTSGECLRGLIAKGLKTVDPIVETKVYEHFYQDTLESRYNGKHEWLTTGRTDITTPEMHIEIKKASKWVQGLRQLLAYGLVAPRKELRLCLFDYYELSAGNMTALKKTLSGPEVAVYRLDLIGAEHWVCGGLPEAERVQPPVIQAPVRKRYIPELDFSTSATK